MKEDKKEIVQSIMTLVTALMLSFTLFSRFAGRTNQGRIIDGRSFYEAGKEVERLHIEEQIAPQREKYRRHYAPALYFEDLEKEKTELNQAFYQYWNRKIEHQIETQAPQLGKTPWLLRTEVEFVNEDVKKYREGILSAQEIIQNPDSIMHIHMEWHVFFETPMTKEELLECFEHIEWHTFFEIPATSEALIEYFHRIERQGIAKEVTEKYIHSNIEQVEFWAYANRVEALEEFSLQQLRETEDIRGLLKNRYGLFGDSCYLKMPYYQSGDMPESFETIRSYSREWALPEPDRVLAHLKRKYRIPFYQKTGRWFAAESYPELFFSVDGWWPDGDDLDDLSDDLEDYFLGTLYQDMLQQQIERIIEEEGMSEELLFFVTVEPEGYGYEEYNPDKRSYDCLHLEEEVFLREGYGGDVDVTLISLTDSPKVYERIAQHEKALERKMRKVLERIDEKICFGKTVPFVEGNKEYESGYKSYYLYEYLLDKEEQKVVRDLFQKYRRTERCPREDVRGLADDFSLHYVTRADTPAFHFLDIFGEKLFEGDRNFHFYPDFEEREYAPAGQQIDTDE